MAEVLPQIRVRADTQSREASSKIETPTLLPLRDATKNIGNGRVNTTESAEGEPPAQLPGFSNTAQPRKTNDIGGAADTATPARQLPITKSYPSKFMQTISGNQAIAASKSPAAEERKDSQAIDPLSHVCIIVSRHRDGTVLRYCAAYPQQSDYAELSASKDALRRR